MAIFSLSEAGHGQHGGQIEKSRNKKFLVFYVLQPHKVSKRSGEGTQNRGQTDRQTDRYTKSSFIGKS